MAIRHRYKQSWIFEIFFYHAVSLGLSVKGGFMVKEWEFKTEKNEIVSNFQL